MVRMLHVSIVVTLLIGTAAAGTPGGAWNLYQARKIQEAYDMARPLLDADPANRELNHLVGRCLVELGRYAQAEPFLNMVVNTSRPTESPYAWCFFYQGHVQWARQQREEARAIWTQARDDKAQQFVGRNAAATLKLTGLAESFAAWTTRETEHAVLRFSPRLAGADLDGAAARLEAAWTQLTTFCGGAPERKVDVLVWADAAEAKAGADLNTLTYARPELWAIHTTLDEPCGRGLARVFARWIFNPRETARLIDEGFAEVAGGTSLDHLAAAREALGDARSAEFDLANWWQKPPAAAPQVLRAVGGAWVQTLLDRGGREKLLLLMAQQGFTHAREIYGADTLKGWLAEFTTAVTAP